VLDAGPAACGYADQCWTLARIADQVWHRFGVEYTLAGMDLLLHRIGWSLCRYRHKLHYADIVVMPTCGRELVVAGAAGLAKSA
jgi:transposase